MLTVIHWLFANKLCAYGHGMGDQVLISIAKVLKSGLRAGDIVGRYGGEEFVCVAVIRNLQDGFILFET